MRGKKKVWPGYLALDPGFGAGSGSVAAVWDLWWVEAVCGCTEEQSGRCPADFPIDSSQKK